MEKLIAFTDIDFGDKNVLKQKAYKQRRSPIFVTISDVQISPVDIQQMMEAGMNVVRFNASNTTKGEKMRMLAKVDKAAMTLSKKIGVADWPIATCLDLKTCVIMTGLLQQDVISIPLKVGSSILLTSNISDFNSCNNEKIFVDNPLLTTEVKVGTEISIGQEELILHCTEIVDKKAIRCIITKGGRLYNMAYVCMRGVKRQRPVLGKRDFQTIKFAMEYQVDILIINYVREAETMKKIKKYIGHKRKRPMLISGICTQDGLDNFDEIARESDAIVLSREFLPYELESSKRYRLCQIQKWVGAKCQSHGKPFYISGEVFHESLLSGEYSDAEVSDVTNSLFDGASGFILENTHDIENLIVTIKSLNDLCCAIEPYTNSKTDFWRLVDEVKQPLNAAEACVLSCATIANQSEARVIVIPTVSGVTARALLRMKPAGIVITVSTKPNVTRLLHTFRCVVPLIYNGPRNRSWHENVEARVLFAIEYAVHRSWLVYGDTYVSLQRSSEESSYCDTVKIWKVTSGKKALVECFYEDDDVKEEKES